jgi:hypothetical protein
MVSGFCRRIVCFSGSIAVLTACQFNQAELKIENLHQGEEVFCAEYHSLIDEGLTNQDSGVFQVSVRALRAPWEVPVQALQEPVKPLQSRKPGTKVAVFTVKKNVLRGGLSSYQPYLLEKNDLLEGEMLTIGRKKLKVVMIGIDGAKVNGKKYCDSEFVYVREMN